MKQPEFDRYSATYEDLLRDPIRDRFADPSSRFFHIRKRDLIRNFFRHQRIDSHQLSYLDVGCGKGDLLELMRNDFRQVAGCDPSAGMLSAATGEIRVQDNPKRIPFLDRSFDFVTAICVYHHVAVADRLSLTREVYRVLKPGGIFAIIEHNPRNPVTRKIVSRTPVDADAVLLPAAETNEWLRQADFVHLATKYFLYFPESLYRPLGWMEPLLAKLPLGGQYAVFSRKDAA